MSRTKLGELLLGQNLHSLILIQSSPEQSTAPLLRNIIKSSSGTVIVLSLLLAPTVFLPLGPTSYVVKSLDYTDLIPGYSASDESRKIVSGLLECIRNVQGDLTLLIDSLTTLTQDLGSPAETYDFLRQLMSDITSKPRRRLIIRAEASSQVLRHIKTTSFTPAFLVIEVYNPGLLHHISKIYFVPPPAGYPSSKFWQVFLPITERNEGTKIAFGPNGTFEDSSEAILHVVDHSQCAGNTSKSPVKRTLEGWMNDEPCELSALSSLRSLRSSTGNGNVQTEQNNLDKISFNVSLTESQQKQRSQVVLPYAHTNTSVVSQITYDPDSADDLDDDDPDDDLDI